ncbi:hypothetical protein ABEB36_012784 [Hypothenemus hampei]|uniref:Carboxylic ester hydrolase n=1 Tax=Hypothenemus hampei TaxID=57062 RepID=A0ABD1EGP1_HYPHA
MNLYSLLVVFEIFFLNNFFASGYNELVSVQQGIVRGRLITTSTNKTFRAFQGIPYAEPPLGSLRFQAPIPPKSWENTLNATEDPNVCYAIDSDSPKESEDCLYLNIYTPILDNDNGTKVPVLLWIYGGGFSHGTSLYSNFGPDFLIEKDIVIVTINYRLGPFGFLSTADTIIPGNAGLKDQAAAIKYTFDNIESFGGDPTKITIAGQSAGAASVGYQLLNQQNQGLFRAAILESGSPLNIWSFLDSNLSRSYAFDLAAKINGSQDFANNSYQLLNYLQKIDAKIIDEAATRIIIRPLPVIEVEHEGAILTNRQYTLLKDGDFIRVPTIIGTNSEEEIHQAANLTNLKNTLEKYEKTPEKFIPSDFIVKQEANISLVADSIKNCYLLNVADDEKMGHIVKFLSHSTFTTAVIKHTYLMSQYSDVYFYMFSYDGIMGNVNVTIKGADGVDHAEDPKYLFMKSDSSYSNEDLSKFPAEDVLTHYRLIELWTNFVKYLNPTPEPVDLLQNITWPMFSPNEPNYLDIDKNLIIRQKPKSPYYESWVRFYDEWAENPLTTF